MFHLSCFILLSTFAQPMVCSCIAIGIVGLLHRHVVTNPRACTDHQEFQPKVSSACRVIMVIKPRRLIN
jgi:hypothetical protein